MLNTHPLRFIDLFSGIGGIRKGFELACAAKSLPCECVFTSEIKPYAVEVLQQNYPKESIHGDIQQISAESIPDFDVLLAGFPCQAFSSAGKRLGFEDTRGTLFFEIARILDTKRPSAFLLENVEGLVTHNRRHIKEKIGQTFSIILETLRDLGYFVSWSILNAKDFGVPQDRKRIYIAGTKTAMPNLREFVPVHNTLSTVLEYGQPVSNSDFVKLLLTHYKVHELYGKSVKDKRGGKDNIHSWDISYKGCVSSCEKQLLNLMLTERRKKKWAEQYGIDWMDGMPLTLEQIQTFYKNPQLESMLHDLVSKGYLKCEHPKRKVDMKRIQDTSLPLGYNIVAGKMSFEINKILDPNGIAPTLVAMDMQRLYVVDGDGLRPLTLREGLRLFGYPDDFKFDVALQNGYDLLGNTVVVPVIQKVAERLLEVK